MIGTFYFCLHFSTKLVETARKTTKLLPKKGLPDNFSQLSLQIIFFQKFH